MKIMKKLILPGILIFAAFLAIMAFTVPGNIFSGNQLNPPQEKVVQVFPDTVQKVLETSCFDCHGATSSNVKALGKLNFSKWNDLTAAQKVGKMQDIIDIIKKGDMPPAKYVTNYPDRAPGKEQKDIIIKWADEESDKLMGN
jgi:hypothetical protein